MRHILLFLLLAIASASASSADYRFRRLTTSGGLTDGRVSVLHVDRRGFLWVGTALGVNRYDGFSVRSLLTFDAQGREPITNVTTIAEDALGRLWVESDAGVSLYDWRDNRFATDARTVLRAMGVAVTGAYKVAAADDGTLWIVATGRVWRVGSEQYAGNAGSRQQPQSWRVSLTLADSRNTTLAPTARGNLFITDGTRLLHFNSHAGRLSTIALPPAMTVDRSHIRIAYDQSHTLWAYSTVSEHICRVSPTGVAEPFTLSSSPAASRSNAIRDILGDAQGRVFIATDHEGLFVYDSHRGLTTQLRHDEHDATSPASDNITALATDRQGTLWLGHFNNGVSYANPQYNLFTRGGTAVGDVSTMLFDRGGRLWIGTDGHGLFVENADGRVTKTSLPDITVSSLLEARDGTLWVGTYNDGLFRMRGTDVAAVYNRENGSLPTNSVWQMSEDAEGRLWYTSVFEALASFTPATGRGAIYRHKGQTVSGLSFAGDWRKAIYCATYYGLWTYDARSRRAQTLLGNRRGTQQFLQPFIGPLCLDDDSQTLWIGHMTGITMWDMRRDTLYYITRKDGLYGANIKALALDRNGNLWASTSHGISCIRRLDDGRGGSVFAIRNFTAQKGVDTEYFNTYAVATDHQGNVYFGGRGGYTRVSTLNLLADAARPQTIIADAALGDSLLTWQRGEGQSGGTVRLTHDAGPLTLTFFTGSIIAADRTIYAYRIDGRQWAYTDQNRVTLPTLMPGSHHIEVKASCEGGEWGESVRLTVSVAPPLWLTWWMKTLYALIALTVAVVLWIAVRRRQRRRMTEQHRRLDERRERQIADMRARQEVEMADMKLRFFTNISHDLRTPLTLIISPLQAMLAGELTTSMRQRLTMMHRNARLLLDQLNQLLDFRRLDVGAETLHRQSIDIVHYLSDVCLSFADYAHERNITLAYEHTADTLFASVDAEKLGKIMRNLISNALKFTPEGGRVAVAINNCAATTVPSGSVGTQHGASVSAADAPYCVSTADAPCCVPTLLITVSDTGCGISDADKQRVFERFYQAETTATTTGSGIGLHIVSEYVRMHGGTLAVTDNTPCGTVFTVTLPAAAESMTGSAGLRPATGDAIIATTRPNRRHRSPSSSPTTTTTCACL